MNNKKPEDSTLPKGDDAPTGQQTDKAGQKATKAAVTGDKPLQPNQ